MHLKACGHFLWWLCVGDPDSLYADDLALILPNLQVVPDVLQDLQMCGKYTGLTLNLDKTIVYDPKVKDDFRFHGVTVMSGPVKYLGTYLGLSPQVAKLNLDGAVQKMKNTAAKWWKHPLTLFAHVTVLKAMIVSKVIHILNTCYVPSTTIDFLQKFANKFVW